MKCPECGSANIGDAAAATCKESVCKDCGGLFMHDEVFESRPVIRMQWTCGPAHDRCAIFVGDSGKTLANAGSLTFRNDGESARFRKTVRMGIQEEGFEGISESGWERGE